MDCDPVMTRDFYLSNTQLSTAIAFAVNLYSVTCLSLPFRLRFSVSTVFGLVRTRVRFSFSVLVLSLCQFVFVFRTVHVSFLVKVTAIKFYSRKVSKILSVLRPGLAASPLQIGIPRRDKESEKNLTEI